MLALIDKIAYQLTKILQKLFRYYYLLIIVICLILITFSMKEYGFFNNASSRTAATVAKITYPLDRMTLRGREIYNSIMRLKEIEYKYLDIKHQNYLLEKKLLHLREVEIDNQKLRELLNFVQSRGFNYVSARLYAVTSGEYFDKAIIGAGTNAGIQINNVVLSSEGVIGRVSKVNWDSSEVILVTDFNSHIPVITAESRQRGILLGRGAKALKLKHISNKYNLKTGELLLTSGDGMHFPKGLPVARISNNQNNLVEASSFLHLNSLEFVSIICE
jgi:rod shape-determining protein MreC